MSTDYGGREGGRDKEGGFQQFRDTTTSPLIYHKSISERELPPPKWIRFNAQSMSDDYLIIRYDKIG